MMQLNHVDLEQTVETIPDTRRWSQVLDHHESLAPSPDETLTDI